MTTNPDAALFFSTLTHPIYEINDACGRVSRLTGPAAAHRLYAVELPESGAKHGLEWSRVEDMTLEALELFRVSQHADDQLPPRRE